MAKSNTISDDEWRRLQDRARRYETQHEGGVLGDAATRRRLANDPKKAGSN